MGIVCYGLIPTAHWIYLYGGVTAPMVQYFVPNVMGVYALMALAFTFYATSLPERLRPGLFDIIGWSHQWWHVLILLALAWWRRAGFDILTYRSNLCAPFSLRNTLSLLQTYTHLLRRRTVQAELHLRHRRIVKREILLMRLSFLRFSLRDDSPKENFSFC